MTEKDLLNTDGSGHAKKRQSQAEKVVNLGLAANTVLAAVKLSAGIIGHSQALLADGINSISDVVYFIVVKIFVALSGKPSDDEHPYGHYQFESIAALVVGAFVITTGIAIFWDSINDAYVILTGTAEDRGLRFFTLWVAVGTIFIKIMLMYHAQLVNRKTGNLAVSALARDHRNDIFASLGAGIGILFGLLNVRWMDPLAGAVVAVIVAKTGIDILRESSADLMDTVPSREMDRKIRILLKDFSQIHEIENIHAHRFGPYLMVNITIGIDGSLTVAEGDKIADEVEDRLYDNIEMLKKIYVHYHPSGTGGINNTEQ